MGLAAETIRREVLTEEALDEGNYDLARKLLELDIEERQKRDEPKPDDV